MQKPYEAPHLTLAGQADHVVMGLTTGGTDNGMRRTSNSNMIGR
jgi:hypothetical protein